MSFSIFGVSEKNKNNQVYRFDFDDAGELDNFWLVSGFGTFDKNQRLALISDGVLTLYSAEDGNMPMMLSKPLDVPPGYVITVQRKVRITRGEGIFSGGFVMYQTDDQNLVPKKSAEHWSKSIGEGIVLVEYSYDLWREEKRPGKNVFRLLAADWEENGNYEILKPKYDEWFEETLIYDTRNHTIHYKTGDKEYVLNSYAVDKPAMRILMHSMGSGSGSKIEIDWIEIKIEYKDYRRAK